MRYGSVLGWVIGSFAVTVMSVSALVPFGQRTLDRMYSTGLTKYTNLEEYRPTDPIQRGEVAKFVQGYAQIVGMPERNRSDTCIFNDTSLYDVTLQGPIFDACKYGLLKGNGESFFPTRTLSEAEAMTMLVRSTAGRLDETVTPWYRAYFLKAQEYGLLVNETVDSVDATPITRAKLGSWMEHMALEFDVINEIWEDFARPDSYAQPQNIPDQPTQPTQPSQSTPPVPGTEGTETATQPNLLLGLLQNERRTRTFYDGNKDKIRYGTLFDLYPIIIGTQGVPQNLIVEAHFEDKYCLQLPNGSVPYDFSTVSEDGGETRQDLAETLQNRVQRTSVPMICNIDAVRVQLPYEWKIFNSLKINLFAPLYRTEEQCIDVLVTADNANYSEFEICNLLVVTDI